jgi:hypothetical protein
MRFSTVYIANTQPHSPTTLAYESITHTSIIHSTRAIYGEADHALTCPYRLLSFPICQLGSHNIRLSYKKNSDDTLIPLCIIASPAPASTHIRRRYRCVNLRPSQTPPAVHYYLSTTYSMTKLIAGHVKHVHNANNSQRYSNPSPRQTH